jgi:MoaA/NifB/PqqE/SkfB family radical SAM enzyme
MKKGFWKNFFQGSGGKRFAAWQVELTSRCPLRCRMCNRIEYEEFSRRDMLLEDFKRLLPYFQDVEAVVLEGWGESLLHKDLIECIRLAKREGPRVGFVTSGKGLNEAYIAELLQVGVDFMGFSLAGATPQTHNAIRVNSDLHDLLQNIRIFQERKSREKLTHPRLHIVYLLLQENIREVPALISLARDLGIGEVVLINLIHVTNSWQDEQKVFAGKNPEEFVKILKEAEAKAREGKIKLRCPSLSYREVAVCAEDPLHNLYISVEGEISPCVYLNPPLPSPFKRIFQGREFYIEKVNWGNLFHEPLDRIWNDKKYVEFRENWTRRKKYFEERVASLWDRDKLKRFATDSFPDPPKPCQTCHKILGV